MACGSTVGKREEVYYRRLRNGTIHANGFRVTLRAASCTGNDCNWPVLFSERKCGESRQLEPLKKQTGPISDNLLSQSRLHRAAPHRSPFMFMTKRVIANLVPTLPCPRVL